MEGAPEKLLMTEAQVVQMVSHALREKPLEACGVVAGRDGAARWIAEMTNAAKSSVEFHAEPRQQLEVFERIEREGLELVGIYHSHPATDEAPSQNDIERAFYPSAVQIIVSLAGSEPVVAGYRIEDGKTDVVEIAVAGEVDRADGALRHGTSSD